MSVVSGIVGAIAGKKGADSQAKAARRASDVSERMFETSREDFAPFREAGTNALAALQFETGLGPRPKSYGGYKATEAYSFRRAEGQRALERSAAARGGLMSGATLKETARFSQGIAAQEYDNYLARLGGIAGVGQSATAATGALGAQSANVQGNALMQAGNARASGYQAIGQGVQQGIQGAGQLYGFGRGQGWF